VLWMGRPMGTLPMPLYRAQGKVATMTLASVGPAHGCTALQ
jgi:hypothetical protein